MARRPARSRHTRPADRLGSSGEPLLQFGQEPVDTLLRRWQPAQPGREPGDHLADGGHHRRRRCASGDDRRGLACGHAIMLLAGRRPAFPSRRSPARTRQPTRPGRAAARRRTPAQSRSGRTARCVGPLQRRPVTPPGPRGFLDGRRRCRHLTCRTVRLGLRMVLCVSNW